MKILKKQNPPASPLKNNKGSITIEASLVFPFIFILIISFIFISLFIYQKVSLYYIASQAAERASYVWNNSYKDPISGEFLMDNNDDLYWRITDDRMLDLLLNNLFHANETKVKIGDYQEVGNAESLPMIKLQKIAEIIPKGIDGTISYNNSLVERRVTVELESPLKIPSFVGELIGTKITATASANIIEPVEFIRTVDFVRVYGNWLINNREKGKGILQNRD